MWKKEPPHQTKDRDKTSNLTKGKDRIIKISKISNDRIEMQQDSDIYI